MKEFYIIRKNKEPMTEIVIQSLQKSESTDLIRNKQEDSSIKESLCHMVRILGKKNSPDIYALEEYEKQGGDTFVVIYKTDKYQKYMPFGYRWMKFVDGEYKSI